VLAVSCWEIGSMEILGLEKSHFSQHGVTKVEHSTGIWAVCKGLLQVACQVSVLALKMIKNALRDASTLARRWVSDLCTSERALRPSLTANSASSPSA